MKEMALRADDRRWTWLFRVAAVGALLSAALVLVAGAVFMMFPPPGFGPSAANGRDWIAFFQAHRLIGLLDLDLVMVADNVIAIPLFLALYVALRRVSESWALMGAGAGLVGVAGYFAVNPAFSMLALSGRYPAAEEAERTAIVGAAQSLLAVYQGTGFNVYLLLLSLAGVIVSAMMLRTELFGRTAGIAGILGNGLALGMYLPALGLYLGFISLLPLLVWYVVVGWKLARLGWARTAETALPAPSETRLAA